MLTLETFGVPGFCADFIPLVLAFIDPTDHFEAMNGVLAMLVNHEASDARLFLRVVGSVENLGNFIGVVNKVTRNNF